MPGTATGTASYGALPENIGGFSPFSDWSDTSGTDSGSGFDADYYNYLVGGGMDPSYFMDSGSTEHRHLLNLMPQLPPWLDVTPAQFGQAAAEGARVNLERSQLQQSAAESAQRLGMEQQRLDSAERQTAMENQIRRDQIAANFQRSQTQLAVAQAYHQNMIGLGKQRIGLEAAKLQQTAQDKAATLSDRAKLCDGRFRRHVPRRSPGQIPACLGAGPCLWRVQIRPAHRNHNPPDSVLADCLKHHRSRLNLHRAGIFGE